MKSKVQVLFFCLVGLCLFPGTLSAQCRDAFPFHPHFESGLFFWDNTSDDDFDWVRQSGGTPTANTGPASAHTGSYYAYAEATGNPNSEALLTSDCIDFSLFEHGFLSFRYHMQGSDIGSLSVDLRIVGESTWTSLFSVSGDQGGQWIYKKIDLSDYDRSVIQLRFQANTGAGDAGDIAIDGCYLYAEKICVGPLLSEEGQGFENGLGQWVSQSPGDWFQAYNYDAEEGPAGGCQGLQFAKLETPSSASAQNYGVLTGPCVDITNALIAEASFCYYINRINSGSASQGQLDIDVSTDDGATWIPRLTLNGESGSWQTASIDLSAYVGSAVRVRFRGQINGNGILGIDNVLIHGGTAKRLGNSLGGQAEMAFSLYPNPALTSATLQWNQPQTAPRTLKLVSLTGQVLQHASFDAEEGPNEWKLDLTGVANGLYLVLLEGENRTLRQRLQVGAR